jgi:hypothetical protein
MSGLAIGVGLATVAGGAIAADKSRSASNKAVDAQKETANNDIELARYMYDQDRQDLIPFRDLELEGAQIRTNALGQLRDELSRGFEASDAYNFNKEQGLGALTSSALAGGVSNNQAAAKFASGLASNEYNNYLNALSGLSGSVGGYQNALSGAGSELTSRVSAANMNAGNAASSGYLANGQTQAQLYGSLGNTAGNALAYYKMLNG